MRIGIVEWNVGCGGGRHSTMMAFADCLFEMGHDVNVFSQIDTDPQKILETYGCRCLPYGKLYDTPLKRRYCRPAEVPTGLHLQDLVMVSYGGFGHLQGHLSMPVVAWVIHPDQARNRACTRYWTNSETTRGRLLETGRWMDAKIEVVVPPHDYSVFRDRSRRYQDRKYDVAVVGSAMPSKRLVEAVKLAITAGRKVAVVVKTCQTSRTPRDTQQGIIESLMLLDCDTLLNLNRGEVASVLGNSKLYFSLSDDESCSLVIYEAMNAGCVPIVYDVGAAKEQVSNLGIAFSSSAEALDLLKDMPRCQDVATRGMLFDRKSTRSALGEAVERAAKT
jgi:glycosyltransferase involved in cell wall biosynthesis